MKVIFLDIDGVLNSHRSAVAFGGMPFDVVAHRARFDEIAVRLVGGIAEAAGAQIVLSSSWRNDVNWTQIGPALGLSISDRTPSLLGPRGREIAAWLGAHPEVTAYAIVDDDGDMLPEQTPYFVRTHMQDGFTWDCAMKLAELMGINIFDVRRGQPLPAETKTLQWEDAAAPKGTP